MDITTVFGTVVGGSNPSGSTKYKNAGQNILHFCISEHFYGIRTGRGRETEVSRGGRIRKTVGFRGVRSPS